ncbi:MAG: helix-hairpin-helix domain-containing protein, partial [Thermodesulfobacteriota bacterium]|nr:helix-hairpin-helix domain-containing protein [Thermodesulfobacteriota bacterium]
MIPSTDKKKAARDIDSYSELEGQVERITYTNEDTGFTVARVNVRGYPDPVTIVGNLISPTPGEILTMGGTWINHPKFGRQFKVISHHTMIPSTVNGIKRYLGSGLIKGIGPVMASRIVKKFGKKTLDVIEHRIEELEQVDGIGHKRVEMITQAWRDQKEIRYVMIFLQEHGVSPGYAVKIYKRYGGRTISVLNQNPYKLATDIHGIGFNSADRIAENLGFSKNTPVRAEAGILYVLFQIKDQGHVYYPYEDLIEKCKEVLRIDREIILNALDSINSDGRIIIEDLDRYLQDFSVTRKAVYLSYCHTSETALADNLIHLIFSPKKIRKIDSDKAIKWVQRKINIELAQKQIEAVKTAISEKVMVITGGPGTGKTTIINAVIKICREVGARILLAAPTGRAAKRMNATTGYPARTIHRMLEFSIQKGGCQSWRPHLLSGHLHPGGDPGFAEILLFE